MGAIYSLIRFCCNCIKLLTQSFMFFPSLFYSLLNEVRSNPRSPRQFMNSDSQFVTVFVPTDEALQKVLTRSRLEALMNDEDQLIDVSNWFSFVLFFKSFFF